MSSGEKDYYSTIHALSSIAAEASELIESDFAAAGGAAYSPPEEGEFRRIDVARTIQLLKNAVLGYKISHTNTGTILRLPCGLLSTNDALDGRPFVIYNAGTSSLAVEDYAGTLLATIKIGQRFIFFHMENNSWQVLFDAKDVKFDNSANKFASTDLQTALVELDGEFKKYNTLIVDKNGNDTTGDGSLNHPYLTINKAISMVTSPSISNPWTILVYPGVYLESPITLPVYTRLQGSGDENTIIQASNVNAHLITASDQSHISNCVLTGATGTGYALVYYQSNTGSENIYVTVENCRLGAADILVWCNANNAPNSIHVNACYLDGLYSFSKGFLATTTGTGIGRVNIRNTTTDSLTAPLPSYIAYASGANCEIVMNGCQFRSETLTSGSCIQADNGGYLRLLSVNIKGFATAIKLLNNGSAPTIRADAVVMDSNTKDIDVLHPTATGQIFGVWSCIKTFNIAPDLRLGTMCTDTGNFGVTATMRIRGFGTEPTNVTAINGDLPLTKYSNYEQVVTGSGTPFTITLPDATTLDEGRRFQVYNNTSNSIVIRTYGGATLFTLSATSVAEIILNTKLTSVGTWIQWQLSISPVATGVINYKITSSVPFVTTSITDVVVTDFTLTPIAGTYAIWYDAAVEVASAPRYHYWVLYKNGVIIADSQRSSLSSRVLQGMNDTTLATASFNGSEAVDLRVRVDASGTTLTVKDRTLLMIRLGS